MKNRFVSLLIASFFALASVSAAAQQAMGKLMVDIQPFTSEVTLKKKVETTLKSGGLEWGAKDGLVVFTMVNKRFVNFDMPNFTRYGEQATIDLPVGDYTITGIGLIPSTGFSPEKILAKGAYFNEKVMSFRIEADQTSKIVIRPVIQKNGTLFVNYFMPELLATTIAPDGSKSSEISIIAKNASSIPWSTYTGPLKFKVQ